jgi:GNAT superfamily N-acetyltransferase
MPQPTIESYSRDHLAGMTDLYCRETAFEPHIAPLTPARFIELVESKSYFDPAGLLVAREGGAVAGWVHACVAPATESWQEAGKLAARIRMLIYPRDRLRVGAALMGAATEWLKAGGAREIEALHPGSGYPFYRGLWLGAEPMGPATMPHVQLALSSHGYQLDFESVLMTAAMADLPPSAPPPPGLEVAEAPAEMAHEGMRESWIGFSPMEAAALIGGEEVGRVGWVLLPHVSEKLGAPCLSIWSLGVNLRHRRRGIGLFLVREAMRRGYALGARHCSVGTQLWNAPAHATYAAAGYRPHCLLVGRKLTLAAGSAPTPPPTPSAPPRTTT